jgi:LasA protease
MIIKKRQSPPPSPSTAMISGTTPVRLVSNGLLALAILLALLLSAAGPLGPLNVSARAQNSGQPALELAPGQVLADGQFVYGPNARDFDLRAYLQANAPHLLDRAELISGQAAYYSISPRVLLALLELNARLLSDPASPGLIDPTGAQGADFNTRLDSIASQMVDAYYLHLYSYSALPATGRNLPPLVTPGGLTITMASDTNAATYALVAGLAAMGQTDLPTVLDNNQPGGFYQLYQRLFAGSDPLDRSNHIYLPGEVGASAAPAALLQLPFLQGVSWRFGGVHNSNGTNVFTDASSLDFYPWPSAWGDDTSNSWVVASAPGVPTRLSDCGFIIQHSDGWETFYYHLEGAKYLTGSIKQNDKIGILANTFAEATCTGGSSTGPHVHYSLRRNGAFVPINGSSLSGWMVHAGRFSYDTDPNYMWVSRAGIIKHAYSDTLTSEGTSVIPNVVSSLRADANPSTAASLRFTVTFSRPVTGVSMDDFALVSTLTGAAITQLTGSGAVYTVTVSTGSGVGTLRLDVIDDDTIVDAGSNPLGGPGLGNGNFSAGQKYTLDRNNRFVSAAALDGWVRELSENSSTGGTINAIATLVVGDDSLNRQFRSLLSFDTSSLPDNAVITRVILRIRKASVSGTDPFGTHGSLTADLRKGFFGTSANLQLADFQFISGQMAVGSFSPYAAQPGWYQLLVKPSAFGAIHLAGTTQFRLRFTLDDNNDLGADLVRFYSAENTAAYQPALIVEYTLP